MANKTKVVLGRGQGSMPIDTKRLPEPKTKRPPQSSGRLSQIAIDKGMTNDTGNPTMDMMPIHDMGPDHIGRPGPGGWARGGGDMKPGAVGPAGQDPFYGGAGRGPVFGGGPSGRDEEMRGGGGSGMFMDARINPDGSHQGRNSDNEFDEWTGPSHGDGQYRPSPYGDQSELIDGWLKGGAMDARESMLGLDDPRRITRPPSRPSPRSGGKPAQKPVRKFKKKRMMPRKPRPTNKFGGE